jgi:urease accessory protein
LTNKLDEDAEVEEAAEAQSAEGQRLPAFDRRAASDVGRKARLELVFSLRRGRTVLTHGYAEPPFRVGAVFPDSHRARMMLAWSAPGVFGADCLEQHVRVERGASVSLTSQSALQAHPSPDGTLARMRTIVEVEASAELRCEWDPLIPFPGARLSQRYDVRLAAGAALYWSDAFMSGREGRGERWAFGTLEHELAVSCGGTLAYLERHRLEPRTQPLTGSWVASDSCYFGTVLFVSSRVLQAPDRLQQELSSFDGLRAAVETLDPAATLVRLMGNRGTAFHEARALIRCRLCA